MRRIREISAKEENFRTEVIEGFAVIRRDPVIPEPIGTIILVPMVVMGYDRDCDGSLMARFEQVDIEDAGDEMAPELLACKTAGEFSAYANCTTHHGLYSTTGLVVTADELRRMYEEAIP